MPVVLEEHVKYLVSFLAFACDGYEVPARGFVIYVQIYAPSWNSGKTSGLDQRG